MKLMIRVLVKILGLFCMFLGGFGGGTDCLVPQIGHMSTPSRSSTPQPGHFIKVISLQFFFYYSIVWREFLEEPIPEMG